MIPHPVSDYAAPRPRHRLRKATAFILRILGCLYTPYAVISGVDVLLSHRFNDWLLLFLTVTSIIFLGINLSADRVVRRWAVMAQIAVLINLGVAFSCLGSALVEPLNDPEAYLLRDLVLCVLIPFQCLLIALALMLFLILRQVKASK